MSDDMQLTGGEHKRGPSFAFKPFDLSEANLNASYEVSATGTLKTAGFEIRGSGIARSDPNKARKSSVTSDQEETIQILDENSNSSNSNSNNNNNNDSLYNNGSNLLSPNSPNPNNNSNNNNNNINNNILNSSDSMDPSSLVELGILGQGACGTVRRALHVPTCKVVALKNVNVFDKDKRKQLVKELEILTTFNSPYLVSFHGAFYATGVTTLVLEYMNRNSLSEVVKMFGPLNEIMLMRVAVQAVRALELLHLNKKIHRDIKPGNLLVNHNAEVKLADFGILAEYVTGVMATTYVGTTLFMSPERIERDAYGPPSDIWSIGLTLYYLAVGRNPYEDSVKDGAGIFGLAKALKSDSVPTLPSNLPFSPQCRDFLSHCIQRSPEQRATASELLQHPWLIQADQIWAQSLARGDPNPLQNRKDSDINDLGVILNIVLDRYYPTASYKRSLFEMARLQQISLSLGIDVSHVQQTFEQMYCLKFNIKN